MSTAAILASLVFVISILSATYRSGEGSVWETKPVSTVQTVTLSTSPEAFLQFPQPATFHAVDQDRLIDFVLSISLTVSESEAQEMVSYLVTAAESEDLDPVLLASLVARESGFNTQALSPSGAMGLGQLMPKTAAGLGIEDAFNPEQNLRGTAKYLKQMLGRWGEREDAIPLALASYKEGYGTLKAREGALSDSARRYIEDILKSVRLILGS